MANSDLQIKTLMPHQEEALQYALGTTTPAFFMEMRLGKTLSAIRWFKTIASRPRNILILAPKAVLPAWEAEIKQDGFKGQFLFPTKGSSAQKFHLISETIKNYDGNGQVIVLLNYETVTSSPCILSYLPWEVLICDESTRIRNPKARITNYLCNNSQKITYRAILTGLPNPESPLDFFSQFRFLRGEFMGHTNYWKFRQSYFVSYNGYEYVPRKSTMLQLKNYIRQHSFIRTRKEVGLGSKKIYQKRYVEQTPDQKKAMKRAIEDFALELEGKTILTKFVPVKLGWMQRIAGGIAENGKAWSDGKVSELEELLLTELRGEKVVVWFKYDAEIQYVAARLRARGFGVGIFTGENRSGVTSSNTLSDGISVMCAQSKCGLFGLDWSKSSTAIYFSNWYDNEIRNQTEDRIAHPKKSEPLLYIDLLTKDTIDEDIVEILQTKKMGSKAALMDLVQKVQERHLCK